jgi:hypothetical protein
VIASTPALRSKMVFEHDAEFSLPADKGDDDAK